MERQISSQDPMVIIGGMRVFGLAADGTDLRDLIAAIDRITTERDGLLSEVECLNSNARVQAKLLADTGRENERTARNRDMWKGQCERQAEQLTRLREALRACADARMPGEARRIALAATLSDTDADRQ